MKKLGEWMHGEWKGNGKIINVINTKNQKTAEMTSWSTKQLKASILDLGMENEDLKEQVYHSVCIVSVCLSKIGVVS